MAVYTIHQPPLRKGETSPDPDRFVLVRDGFYFWAFLLGPVWMIWRRLWLTLVLYVIVIVALETAMRYLGVNSPLRTLVAFAVAILVGLEAATLQRWTLGRRGWKNVGVVVADDVDTAERRFFANWTDNAANTDVPTPAQRGSTSPQTVLPRAPKDNGQDIIGLFPQAGQPR